MSLGQILVLIYLKLCKSFALLMFASLLSNPSFLSSLVDPKVRVLPKGEYSNFACVNASGL